jgi:hypothetical protein
MLDTLENLYCEVTALLADKFVELKDQLNPPTADKFIKYMEKMDTKKCFEHVVYDLVLMLYNAKKW